MHASHILIQLFDLNNTMLVWQHYRKKNRVYKQSMRQQMIEIVL